MKLEVEKTSGATILVLIGRLDSSNAGDAESTVLGMIREGGTALVFDFAQLDYISSAGLRVILTAAKRLKAAGGKMALCNLKAPIREVFELGGFLTLLPVVASRDEALTQVA